MSRRAILINVIGLSLSCSLTISSCATPTPTQQPAPPSASFAIDDLVVEPNEVSPGETVTISAVVRNSGTAQGNYTATLLIDNNFESGQDVNVGGNGSAKITFRVAKNDPGTHSVNINGLVGDFVVLASTSTPPPEPTPPPSPAEDLPDIEAFVSTPDWQPSYTIAELTEIKLQMSQFFNEDYYGSRPHLSDKYDPHDLQALKQVLKDMKELPWQYQAGYFDCSEMSALVELYLEVAGFDTVIVSGRDPAVQGPGHAWVVVFLEQPEFEAIPVEATSLSIPRKTGNIYSNGVVMNYADYLRSGWVLRDIYEAEAYRPQEFDWWNSYPLTLDEIFGEPPAPTPAPTPTPTPVPTPVVPQTIQYQMPSGCVVHSSVAYSSYLDAGEQITGYAELTGKHYSTDWSYEWEFHILGPGGESMDDWTGHYVNNPRHDFNCTASYAGTYTIRVSHVSCYPKTLVIEVTPPGWGYSGK
jgi:hypothetical protein